MKFVLFCLCVIVVVCNAMDIPPFVMPWAPPEQVNIEVCLPYLLMNMLICEDTLALYFRSVMKLCQYVHQVFTFLQKKRDVHMSRNLMLMDVLTVILKTAVKYAICLTENMFA